MRSVNPATEQIIAEYDDHTSEQIERAIQLAVDGFERWRSLSLNQRADCLRRVAAILRERKPALAELMTAEMGKPIAASESEVEKCAAGCAYFAEHAPAWLQARDMPSDASRSYVRFDPVGPILAIMPWNFPLWQVFRFAAPALMVGNVALLKHAPNVPGCALSIEEIFRQADAPPGVLTALLIEDNARAQALVEHPVIRAVTLTGSERAGSAVSAAAGKALKKTVMELGGSDPFVVLPDVDIPAIARAAVDARCVNNGQSCIAAKRFIVIESIYDAFVREMTSAMSRLVVGDPRDRATQIGPMARLDLLQGLDRQVQQSIERGARLQVGAKRRPGKGFFYEPTVLSEVRPGMPAFDEETFGPVAAVIRAKDVDDAIGLANQSIYGLGASVWTRDTKLAERLAAKIESGNVFINGPVKSDARLPFGGIKNSGWGRELSPFGLAEFANIKTVWMK